MCDLVSSKLFSRLPFQLTDYEVSLFLSLFDSLSSGILAKLVYFRPKVFDVLITTRLGEYEVKVI